MYWSDMRFLPLQWNDTCLKRFIIQCSECGSTISLDISFKKRAEKPSGPVALVVSNDDKWDKTVETERSGKANWLNSSIVD